MGNRIINRYKSWRLRRLSKRIAGMQEARWSMPYIDPVNGQKTDWISKKPLFFTDATALQNFVNSMAIAGATISCVSSFTSDPGDPPRDTVFDTIDAFIKTDAGSRTSLAIIFSEKRNGTSLGEGVITFASKTATQKAETRILAYSAESTANALIRACKQHAKPMRLLARHRTIPIVEPIDSTEESDRRSRWETNWKNILVSAISGLLAGIVPLIVKVALHL